MIIYLCDYKSRLIYSVKLDKTRVEDVFRNLEAFENIIFILLLVFTSAFSISSFLSSLSRMSKRGVSFADSVETRTFNSEELPPGLLDDESAPKKEASEFIEDEVCYSLTFEFAWFQDGIPIKKKTKHTLDSDEEDNDDHQELDMQKVISYL